MLAVKEGQTDTPTDTHTGRQIKLGGATVYQTVMIKEGYNVVKSVVEIDTCIIKG